MSPESVLGEIHSGLDIGRDGSSFQFGKEQRVKICLGRDQLAIYIYIYIIYIYIYLYIKICLP
jgi:hypothetical protein